VFERAAALEWVPAESMNPIEGAIKFAVARLVFVEAHRARQQRKRVASVDVLVSTRMLAGLLCVIVLLGALFVLRVGPGGGLCEGGVAPEARVRGKWLGLAFVLLSEVPVFRLAPWGRDAPLPLWGDSASHARVAAEIARTGIPHGWIDSYVGGFPFGHHYPQLGWLLLAAEIRMGASPVFAVYLLGFGATLALPLALYFGLVRCGVRPGFAALGAALLGWVSPYNPFIGGYETFFSLGLVSQALVMPLCTWLVVTTLKNPNRWETPVAAWLSMSSHPQVTAAVLVVLGLSACASGRRDTILNTLWTGAMALIAGAALYGQGVRTLDIPFGWPANMGWRQFGFQPARLRWWLLDGDLLDLHRAPVMTALLAAALLLLLFDGRRATSRALVVALVASLLLSVSGNWLRGTGRLGAVLLSFLQPLRVVCLVPPLAAVCVAVALERAARSLASSLHGMERKQLGHRVGAALLLLATGISSVALSSRWKYAEKLRAVQLDATSCSGEGQTAPSGYDRAMLQSSVAALSGGKLWYETLRDTDLVRCIGRDGIDLASAVPTAAAGAVGAHVGILAGAAESLDPERPGSALRAESLGIGYLLLERENLSAIPGWTVHKQWGRVQLLSQPAEVVGVGCIERRWRGSRESIRTRLIDELARPWAADGLLDPHHFTAIEYAEGPVAESVDSAADCNYGAASVSHVSSRSGHISAQVESSTPVDVAFRATAFPTWEVRIDDAPAGTPTLLAPGFFSVRMPPGRHQLAATVSLLPGYALLVALAALATAALARYRGRPTRVHVQGTGSSAPSPSTLRRR
jgi:hypothetical protein